MKFMKTLAAKPWIVNPNEEFIAPILAPEKVAMRFFLAVISVLFSLFLVTFLARSQLPDFQPLASKPWQPLSDSSQLWLNSGLLLCSCVFMQRALVLQRQERLLSSRSRMAAAVFFALCFLLAQLWLWKALWQQGFYFTANPANSYFYLFTALHGLHLIGGLWVLMRFWLSNDSHKPAKNTLELCTTYWHYLLLLWLCIFAVLVSSPASYKFMAALCGF